MVFDASTVFVVALMVLIVALLSWAEIHSRRQQAAGPEAPSVPAPPPGSPRPHRR